MKEKVMLLKESDAEYFSTSELSAKGFSKYEISKLVKQNELQKVAHGQYLLKEHLKDEFAILQRNNTNLIFSMESALYLHNLTGRFPREIAVSVPSGYHLRQKGLKIYYSKKEVFNLGGIEMMSPFGNVIKVYDAERTICDLIKNKKRVEQQVYIESIQNYFLHRKVNFRKLCKYAKQLGVYKQVVLISQFYTAP